MNTLLLDTSTHDICSDAYGNIAMASDPYALAQDVASACAVFLGELWYDTTQGIPYLQDILGKPPATAFLQAGLVQAALTVPEVVEAKVVFLSFEGDTLTGQIEFSDVSGTLARATLSAKINAEAQDAGLFGDLLDINFILDVSELQ